MYLTRTDPWSVLTVVMNLECNPVCSLRKQLRNKRKLVEKRNKNTKHIINELTWKSHHKSKTLIVIQKQLFQVNSGSVLDFKCLFPVSSQTQNSSQIVKERGKKWKKTCIRELNRDFKKKIFNAVLTFPQEPKKSNNVKGASILDLFLSHRNNFLLVQDTYTIFSCASKLEN